MASDSGKKSLRSSKTADLAAAARVYHRMRCSPPVFDDPLAIDFCGRFWRTVANTPLLTRIIVEGLLRPLLPVVNLVVARARFGEDRLFEEIADGVDQYVLVGAGHDTFALRYPEVLDGVRVFEVDQPATQATKLERIRKSRLKVPPNLNFVSADLNEVDLFEALADADFDHDRPAVFAWFGVTYYLSAETVETTLAKLCKRSAGGSTVMFDYQAAPSWTPAASKEVQRKTARFVANRGEPWLSSLDPDRLVELLASHGYSEIRHILPNQLKSEFFADHPDADIPEFFGLCSARV